MNAIVVKEYGQETSFESMNMEVPSVKEGEVLVRVAASNVNTVDTMIKNMGEALPFSPQTPAILGMDLAGTVEKGGLKPLLDEQQFTIDKVGEAYARLESRQVIGKVVIEN